MISMQKTLIILTPGFPADESDSNCLPAQQQFVAMLQKNFPELQIIIVTVQYPAPGEDYLWNHIRVISLNIRKGFYTRFAWIRIWNALKKLKDENSISGLVIFWCSAHALPAFWLARAYRIPHYCWILGQDARKDNHVVKLIRPKPWELIAISDFLQNEFYENHGVKAARVIPVGVNKNSFAEDTAGRFIDILGAGSLIPLKQYHLFVEIVQSLLSSFPDLKALLFGTGTEKEMLQEKVGQLHIGNNLKLMDEISHDELVAVMHHGKIFLHPSRYEGFSSACLEALSAGAHVVSFQRPMEREFPHWHTVHSIREMYLKTLSLLQSDALDYEAIVPYTISSATKQIMALF